MLWPLWPQVEDYLGRERFKVDLARLFQHRRAVCVWGDRGSGKTALCVEFCRPELERVDESPFKALETGPTGPYWRLKARD